MQGSCSIFGIHIVLGVISTCIARSIHGNNRENLELKGICVSVVSRLKKIRKRLRRLKSPFPSLMMCAVLVLIPLIHSYVTEQDATEAVIQKLSSDNTDRQVFLTRQYVSNEEQVALGRMSSTSIIELMKQHPKWYGLVDEAGDVRLTEEVDDIPDQVKEKGYISVDRDGTLTLYDGPPQHNRAVRTFFQVDVSSMESRLPSTVWKEMKEGVRINDVDEYNSVLSTFSDYAK